MLDAPTTNQALVEAAANPEDTDSWQRLYVAYHAPLCRHGAASGLSPAESEEVAQQILAKLAQRLAKSAFNWNAVSLRGWLSQMTNQAIFEVHRLRRRHDLSPAARLVIQQWLPPALAPELDRDAREQLEAHLWSVCLARVRHAVPPHQWQIFEAYALQGNPASEVARRFNTTGVHVRVLRHRMVARIRREWAHLASSPLPDPEA